MTIILSVVDYLNKSFPPSKARLILYWVHVLKSTFPQKFILNLFISIWDPTEISHLFFHS